MSGKMNTVFFKYLVFIISVCTALGMSACSKKSQTGDGGNDNGPASSDGSDSGGLSNDDSESEDVGSDDGPPSSDGSDDGGLSRDDSDSTDVDSDDSESNADADGPPASDDSDYGGLSTDDSESEDSAKADTATAVHVTDNDTHTDTGASDFTEVVGGVSFEMIYIPGCTFTLGCEETSGCPPDTTPVEDVRVSNYHIMRNEVTIALWEAVTGNSWSGTSDPGSPFTGTWYDCEKLACDLGKKTGRAYRMMTEAEFEYAAKNHLSRLAQIDGSEEWAFDSWSANYDASSGDVDPLGANIGAHTQKALRDTPTNNITGRRIRSIDGIGPHCRLAISAGMAFPPDFVPPCEGGFHGNDLYPNNSYRDPRLITGSDAHWKTGANPVMDTFDLRVWEDGTATLNGSEGQWFTSNNIVLVFVSSSGESISYPYILLDDSRGSVICDKFLMDGGYFGRIEKEASSAVKPVISDLKSGEELAAAAGSDYAMVNMENIPDSVKEQDPRLFDGPDDCWFQNNIDVGGTFNYRKDVDTDEYRLAHIEDGVVTMLANGDWFTVGNTFLRVTHSGGYTADYLYTFTDEGYLFQLSFQGYEQGDYRMFRTYSNNNDNFPATCIDDTCSNELPRGAPASDYASMDDGGSTFTPAPCPGWGCD